MAFPKGFRFRFYGKTYTRMFVGSDGHLTFNAPDSTSTARDLDRLISGPPHIAPLFADLDPSAASGNGGVYVLAGKTKIVVTWLDVPEFGTTNHNTVQAVLYPDGRITFAFGRIDAREAVVGVAPGGNGPVQLVDYTASLPTGVIKVAVAERFVANRSFDHFAVARAFFREFANDYDHLIVFLDFSQSLGRGAFAFEVSVRNEVRGIGEDVFDFSSQLGSKGRLRSFVQMGTLSRYPHHPNTQFLGTNPPSTSWGRRPATAGSRSFISSTATVKKSRRPARPRPRALGFSTTPWPRTWRAISSARTAATVSPPSPPPSATAR